MVHSPQGWVPVEMPRLRDQFVGVPVTRSWELGSPAVRSGWSEGANHGTSRVRTVALAGAEGGVKSDPYVTPMYGLYMADV